MMEGMIPALIQTPIKAPINMKMKIGMRPDTLFKADCKSIKCRKRLLLSQVKCIFALKESFFDRGKRKQNIVIRSFLNRYLILIKQK